MRLWEKESDKSSPGLASAVSEKRREDTETRKEGVKVMLQPLHGDRHGSAKRQA